MNTLSDAPQRRRKQGCRAPTVRFAHCRAHTLLLGLMACFAKRQAQDVRAEVSAANGVSAEHPAHFASLRRAFVVLPLLALAGCAEPPPRLFIVNQPMAPVRLIHEGAPGWWLSDALYEATLLRLDELKERNNE